MIPAEQLSSTFEANHMLAKRLIDGLSHAESLLVPDFQINCLNWVLGHIVNNRNEVLRYLDQPAFWGEAETARYQSGSERITPATALPLEQLVEALDHAQADVERALQAISADALAQVVETRFGDRPRWQHLGGLGWHETYHVGQLELLRQLALDRRA